MRFELTKSSSQQEQITTFYKTDIPIEDEDIDRLAAEIKSLLREPLNLAGQGDIILLADMQTNCYIVEIIEPIKVRYIHRLKRIIEF